MGDHERDEIMRLQAQLRQLRLDFEDLRAEFARLAPRQAEDSPLQRAFEVNQAGELLQWARERDERDRG